jgi:hypothetical protein
MFGYDGADYRVVKVDTSGNLVAAVLAGSSIEVTQDTAADLKATVNIASGQSLSARGAGWDGSAWRKNPILLGYADTVSEEVTNLTPGAGTITLTGTTVPSGEVWVLLNIAAKNDTRSAQLIYCVANIGGVQCILLNVASPTVGLWAVANGQWVLEAGDSVQAVITSVTAGDDLYLRYSGYKFYIAAE